MNLKLNGNGKDECIGSVDLQLSIHDSIHLVDRASWDRFSREIYLSHDYLRVLEDTMSGEMEFRYVLFHCPQHTLMGIAYFQVVFLEDNGSKYREAVDRLGKGIGSSVLRDKRIRVLVNGNVFHCGNFGYRFDERLDTSEQVKAIDATMKRLRSGSKFSPNVALYMFKEFWPRHNGMAKSFAKRNYHPLHMDVNMVLELRPEWTDMEVYFGSLNKKARTRFRSILKKSSRLEIRGMDAEAIRSSEKQMQVLFDQVLEQSPFIFGRLNISVYADWKEALGDDLMFHGFYLDGRMVGFNSAFIVNEELDAHYVGIDYELNREHLIYQRMLVDLLEFGLERKVKAINYGRTAEQAKSNIGARPVDMVLFVKHKSGLANKLIGPLISSVKPSEFELREPFKNIVG